MAPSKEITESSPKTQKKVREIKEEMRTPKKKQRKAAAPKATLYKLMPEIYRCLSYLEQRNKALDPIFTESSKRIERPIIEEKFVELLTMVQTYDPETDSFDFSKSPLISKVM